MVLKVQARASGAQEQHQEPGQRGDQRPPAQQRQKAKRRQHPKQVFKPRTARELACDQHRVADRSEDPLVPVAPVLRKQPSIGIERPPKCAGAHLKSSQNRTSPMPITAWSGLPREGACPPRAPHRATSPIRSPRRRQARTPSPPKPAGARSLPMRARSRARFAARDRRQEQRQHEDLGMEIKEIRAARRRIRPIQERQSGRGPRGSRE